MWEIEREGDLVADDFNLCFDREREREREFKALGENVLFVIGAMPVACSLTKKMGYMA